MKKKVSGIMVLLMLTTMVVLQAPAKVSAAVWTPTLKPVRVLEIQPENGATDFTSTERATLKTAAGNREVVVDTMPVTLFNAKAFDINGLYDIVYLGNKSTNMPYVGAYGGTPAISISAQYQRGVLTSNGMAEFNVENDITDLAASKITSFAKTGQMVIFRSALKSVSNSKIGRNMTSLSALHLSNVTELSADASLNSTLNGFRNNSKRPYLNFTIFPKKYDSSNDASLMNGGVLSFKFDAWNEAGHDMVAQLYVDKNGDGVFKSDDLATSITLSGNSQDVVMNYQLGTTFSGLVIWKLVLVDNVTGAAAYDGDVTGATNGVLASVFPDSVGTTAYKDQTLQINILQIMPSGYNYASPASNTFRLVNLPASMLSKPGQFNISIKEISASDFISAYSSTMTPAPKTAVPFQKPGTSTVIYQDVPLTLNGNYDMVVIGFVDSYAFGSPNTNTEAVLKNFIKSGQAVMFTHDTIFDKNTSNSTNMGIDDFTNKFRSWVGQDIFNSADLKTGVVTSKTMPRIGSPNNQITYGFSRQNIIRKINQTFITTTATKRINTNFLSTYPYSLPESLAVQTTHFQYFKLDLEDPDVVPVYAYDNTNGNTNYRWYDPANDYYTYTRGSVTYSGTGHAVPSMSASSLELQMFVNTMIKASVGANHKPAVSVSGVSDGALFHNSTTTLPVKLVASDYDKDPLTYSVSAVSYRWNDSNGNNIIDAGEYTNPTNYSIVTPESNTSIRNDGVGIDLSLPTGNAGEAVRVVAYTFKVTDSRGAEAYQTLTVGLKPQATLSYATKDRNLLLGETVTVPFAFEKTGAGTPGSGNIIVAENGATLEFRDDIYGYTLKDGWIYGGTVTKDDGFTYRTLKNSLGVVSLANSDAIIKNLDITPKKITVQDSETVIRTSLTYTNTIGKTITQTGEIRMPVKNGMINLSVSGPQGASVPSVPVKLRKTDSTGTADNGYVTVTEQRDTANQIVAGYVNYAPDQNTTAVSLNGTGLVSFNKLQTGWYQAEYTVPAGYDNAGTVRRTAAFHVTSDTNSNSFSDTLTGDLIYGEKLYFLMDAATGTTADHYDVRTSGTAIWSHSSDLEFQFSVKRQAGLVEPKLALPSGVALKSNGINKLYKKEGDVWVLVPGAGFSITNSGSNGIVSVSGSFPAGEYKMDISATMNQSLVTSQSRLVTVQSVRANEGGVYPNFSHTVAPVSYELVDADQNTDQPGNTPTTDRVDSKLTVASTNNGTGLVLVKGSPFKVKISLRIPDGGAQGSTLQFGNFTSTVPGMLTNSAAQVVSVKNTTTGATYNTASGLPEGAYEVTFSLKLTTTMDAGSQFTLALGASTINASDKVVPTFTTSGQVIITVNELPDMQ